MSIPEKKVLDGCLRCCFLDDQKAGRRVVTVVTVVTVLDGCCGFLPHHQRSAACQRSSSAVGDEVPVPGANGAPLLSLVSGVRPQWVDD